MMKEYDKILCRMSFYEGSASMKVMFLRRRWKKRSFFKGGGQGDIDNDIHQILIVTVVSILKLLLMLVCMLKLNNDDGLAGKFET